ncbi:MAG TPA: DUF167 domain-containing protein [Syntrophales bacterium]|nr:DUF167 domain-containing protein [Syntrophales bacterium]
MPEIGELEVHQTEKGASFQVQVVPRASRTEVAGLHGNALKLRVAAPPVEGKANEEIVRFLAGLLGLRKADVSITAGLTSKRKTVLVRGTTAKDLRSALVPQQSLWE